MGCMHKGASLGALSKPSAHLPFPEGTSTRLLPWHRSCDCCPCCPSLTCAMSPCLLFSSSEFLPSCLADARVTARAVPQVWGKSTSMALVTREQNHMGSDWKRPLRSRSPSCAQSPRCHSDQGAECHVQSRLEPLRGWGLQHLPGIPIPVSERLGSGLSEGSLLSRPGPGPPQLQVVVWAVLGLAAITETQLCVTTFRDSMTWSMIEVPWLEEHMILGN